MWLISRSVSQSDPARRSRKGSMGSAPLPRIAQPAASGLAAVVLIFSGIMAPVQAQSLVRPDLEVGSQDASVAELQGVLKLLGFYDGLVTGVYSEETSQAVGRFQTAAGLSMTGRVTASTWDKLLPPSGRATPPAPPQPVVAVPQPAPTPKPAPSPAPKPAPTAEAEADPFPILREGAEGDAVARLQQLLQRRGVFDGGIDGDFGPMTLEAVKAAQEKLGLEPDGVVGPATWEALRR